MMYKNNRILKIVYYFLKRKDETHGTKVMFAFLQRRSDGIETFYSNICISIVSPLRMERHETLKKMIYWNTFGTKIHCLQPIFGEIFTRAFSSTVKFY